MAVTVTPMVDKAGTIERISKEMSFLHDRERALNDEFDKARDKIARDWWNTVMREFMLTSDHVKLLKRMTFTLIENTDVVSVGADGKRPFGNDDWVDDVYTILGWTATFDREGMDEASIDRALRIVAELPLALNAIIKQLDLSEG